MKLLALPGRNPETEAWMRSLATGLALGQQDSEVVRYAHWDTGAEPDVAAEAARLKLHREDVVVGKSMGTLVLLSAAATQGNPESAVFIGTPLQAYSPVQRQALRQFAGATPSLFIQQTEDVTGTYEALHNALEGAGRATLVEVPGHDHVYADTAMLVDVIGRWWPERGSGRG